MKDLGVPKLTGGSVIRKPFQLSASTAEIERIALKFKTITNAKVEAWNSGDIEAIQALYTNNIVFIDTTFNDHLIGIDAVMVMAREFVSSFPLLRRKAKNHFISREDSLSVYDYWGFRLGSIEFTPDNPMLLTFLLQTHDDLISYWTLFYGLETMEKVKLTSMERLDEAKTLLLSYSSAWSSGNPHIIATLYNNDAVRKDTTFGEFLVGSEAISSFAESFFVRCPGSKLTLLQAFGEGKGETPTIGGIYAVEVTDIANQPCEILVAVLLKASEGKITHEALYYESDSLIDCGWAQEVYKK
jgi:hypothetical protein